MNNDILNGIWTKYIVKHINKQIILLQLSVIFGTEHAINVVKCEIMLTITTVINIVSALSSTHVVNEMYAYSAYIPVKKNSGNTAILNAKVIIIQELIN